MHRSENSGEQYSVTSAVFRPWETTRGIGTPPRHRTSFLRRTDESHSFHRLAAASASALTNLWLPINCGKRCFPATRLHSRIRAESLEDRIVLELASRKISSFRGARNFNSRQSMWIFTVTVIERTKRYNVPGIIGEQKISKYIKFARVKNLLILLTSRAITEESRLRLATRGNCFMRTDTFSTLSYIAYVSLPAVTTFTKLCFECNTGWCVFVCFDPDVYNTECVANNVKSSLSEIGTERIKLISAASWKEISKIFSCCLLCFSFYDFNSYKY